MKKVRLDLRFKIDQMMQIRVMYHYYPFSLINSCIVSNVSRAMPDA